MKIKDLMESLNTTMANLKWYWDDNKEYTKVTINELTYNIIIEHWIIR